MKPGEGAKGRRGEGETGRGGDGVRERLDEFKISIYYQIIKLRNILMD